MKLSNDIHEVKHGESKRRSLAGLGGPGLVSLSPESNEKTRQLGVLILEMIMISMGIISL